MYTYSHVSICHYIVEYCQLIEILYLLNTSTTRIFKINVYYKKFLTTRIKKILINQITTHTYNCNYKNVKFLR